MRAQQAVEGGQMLALVNRKLLITATSAAESPVYGKMIKEAGLTEWQALTLALLAERALGPRSFWAPYLEVLPDQAAHPLLWDEAQAAAWLAGSPMLRVLQARRQQILDDCEALQVAGANELPAVAGCWAERGHLYPAATGGGSDELVTVASVTWAAATLLSRGISLDLALEEDPIEGE